MRSSADYLVAKEFVTAFVDEAVKLFLLIVVMFIVLWLIGVYLMFWPITVPLTVIGLVSALRIHFHSCHDGRSSDADARVECSWGGVRGAHTAGEFVAPNMATLVQWIYEQRVPPHSYVFTCDLDAWRAASQIEELAPAFAHRA